MHLPTLNPDTIIAAVLVASALYAFVGGTVRVRSFILATYVGIVLAGTAATVAPYAKSLGTLGLDLVLLGSPVVLFALPPHHSRGHKGNGIINILMGLAAGAFLVVAALHVIPPSVATQVENNSLFASNLQGFYIWFVILMPLVALIPHIMEHRHKRAHHG
jgi:zinc transporter ZupT